MGQVNKRQDIRWFAGWRELGNGNFPWHRPTTFERILFLVFAGIGVESILWFGEWWFLGSHRRQALLFALLSFALFWGVFRSLINWSIYFFVDAPKPKRLHVNAVTPSVDVLTTAMPGEPFEMFERSLTAIVNMELKHNTFLLDGGNQAPLIALCERLGVTHVDCTGIQGAKAGKINYCLQNFSRSEFVFIIDPDHEPRKEFLQVVLPHFHDPKTGFVQVVQAYHNRHETFVAAGAAEQTYGFYGPTLMGLSGLGIATAIGANCVFRRKALDSIGGHAVHLAEDALTSMRIHAAGWKSLYLPYRGTQGLSPSDLSSFYKQQVKWSTGMFYLLLHEIPKLLGKFPWAAKLHYLGAGTFYLGGVATLLHLVLPVFFLFCQVFAVEMPLDVFLLHLAPYVFSTVVMHMLVIRWYTHRDERIFPWRSMVLDKATWHIYLMGLVSGLLGRRVEYVPTPKESTGGKAPGAVVPHWIMIGLNLAAVLFALLTYYRIDDGTILMIVFALLNVVCLLPVALVGVLGNGFLRFDNV